MKLEYTPRNLFRAVPTALLQEYFEQRRLLTDFDWAGPDADIEPLHSAWVALPSQDRQSTSVDFQSAFGLCSKQGIQTLRDAGHSNSVDVLPIMAKGKSNIEKVFRVLLEEPKVFRVASYFTWADNLKRYWYRRRDLPQVAPDLGQEACLGLKRVISAHYVQNEGRGEFCEVETYEREGAHYVMVYLADYPAAVVCFEDSDRLQRSLQQQAFDVVFIYDPARGKLDLYAEGGYELRKSLGEMFAKHVLRQEVSLDAIPAPVFDLERLKDPAFRFKIDPLDGLKAMHLKSMRFSVRGGEPGVITVGTAPRSKNGSLHAIIKRSLNVSNLPMESMRVEHVTIQATFSHGNPRPASVTFNLTANNACNLKDTTEHSAIRECLRRSEIICE